MLECFLLSIWDPLPKIASSNFIWKLILQCTRYIVVQKEETAINQWNTYRFALCISVGWIRIFDFRFTSSQFHSIWKRNTRGTYQNYSKPYIKKNLILCVEITLPKASFIIGSFASSSSSAASSNGENAYLKIKVQIRQKFADKVCSKYSLKLYFFQSTWSTTCVITFDCY